MIGFNFKKTVQAAAYLLSGKSGSRDNYMRVLKLLYLADRASLAKRGIPISGDTPWAMERGPVPGRSLDLIKGSDPQAQEWSAFIARDGYDIEKIREPGNMELSRAEINVLEEVAEQFRGLDEWAMVDWCHKNLPEYESSWNRRGTSKRYQIPLADILAAIGRPGEEHSVVSQINEDAYFRKLFGDHEPHLGDS